MRLIFHIDFNSYFATVEQQANPRLRGKPIGVTGGDRLQRTVLGAASIEAKKFGVKTGMQIWEAQRLCPQIIIVAGDSDKYLETTKRFLNILKDYSPYLEVFSIDEAFLALDNYATPLQLAQEIKSRIRAEIGEWISCSIGISYNKLMAKLAGSLYKPDGCVMIADEKAAQFILDKIALDEVCGIGSRIKKRLFNLGITNFVKLRQTPKAALLASFKSYGQILYHISRGIDHSPLVPFYEKEEVKSIGHRHTLVKDTADPVTIKQILLKLTELIARRLRAKNLVGKTVSCWYRSATISGQSAFLGDGKQTTIVYTNDGLEIFQAAWKIFGEIWNKDSIRMIGVSIANLNSQYPRNLSLLADVHKQERITKVADKINDKFGEFSLSRGVLLGTGRIYRKPNPFLSDRRFKL